MRPDTLSNACERILAGEASEKAFAERLDVFYGAPDAAARLRVIGDPPPFTGEARTDAFVAAAAEYLARQYRLGTIPGWAMDARRYLPEPWFTTKSQSPALREFLAFSSPAEFRSRNIFTEERPLRRASQSRAPG